MKLPLSMRALAMAPLKALLKPRWLRRRLVFELQHRFHAELGIAIPLSHGLQCPIVTGEEWSSFEHIFFAGEYARAFEHIPLPTRWLDLGCYAGFFSLYVVWRRAQQRLAGPVKALLIDGDARSGPAIETLARRNGLEAQFQFMHGAIAKGEGCAGFVERPYTLSSLNGAAVIGEVARSVPIVTAGKILRAMPPPYDLIKVDIEGGEYDFLQHYGDVLSATRNLILEWHSWHSGGGGEKQLIELLASKRFRLVARILEPAEANHRQGERLSGVHLYERREAGE
jgi:FkbM family methyltransferase